MSSDQSPPPSARTERSERRDQRIATQQAKMTSEQMQKLSLIFSLMIGVACVLALWAGRERMILLVIPVAVMASVGAIVLTNPMFPRRRWLLILALPVLFWTFGLILNP
ncbi:MAG: hypothetical protein QM753_13690 [Thermomicrobiales bacterium]